MKRKKLLIGLIVAAFVCGAHFASAQSKANYQNNLIEIGPDNIAGRVRAIVVDESDPTHHTLYAGGVAGGLYRSMGESNWHYIPYYRNGQEVTLPISCMVQLSDNSLLVGTGEGFVDKHGVNDNRMAPKGRGVYHFDPTTYTFAMLSATNPIVNPEWSYVNRLAYLEREVNGVKYLYVYAATNEGLYRWKFNANNPDWTATPNLVIAGKFYDVVILSADNVAYATAPGKIYRIGSVTGESAAVDITSSNSVFATSSRIEIAAATAHNVDSQTGNIEHKTYLYAVVTDSTGLFDGAFLTHDQQNWTRLTTPTVTPFTKENPGTLNSAIAINVRNIKEIFIGGATVWQGEGFVDNSYYQWTKQSYSESELNSGNYMGSVYSNSMFLHSGVHQIICTYEINGQGDTNWVNLYATDGGVYKGSTSTNNSGFRSLNKGLNTVQFNHIAVSPDGSIIGGAVDNSCPFIQSRNAHDGAVESNTWYDTNSQSIFNHLANVIWLGNGGGVASSMFQQLLPYTRRALFVSCEPGHFTYAGGMSGVASAASFGRACTDYMDYTNTQTWTVAEAFVSDLIPSNNPIPQIRLWETTNNTIWNDKITFRLDTNGTYIHNGVETPLTGSTQIVAGDKVRVSSKPTFDYPFYHTFQHSFIAKDSMTHTVHNPVVSRMIVNGRTSKGFGAVYFTTTPDYFRNVWDPNEASSTDNSTLEKLMNWSQIYTSEADQTVGDIIFSRDGKSIFIVVSNNTTGKSFVFRLYDIVNTDVNDFTNMKIQLNFSIDDPIHNPNNPRVTHFDTIFASDGNYFNRPITSLAIDPRDGQDNLIITFGDYNNGDPNLVYVKNASNPATRTISNISVANNQTGMSATDPVYSAIVECTTGTIFAGTEKGVYATASATSPVWQTYGSFNGVPVTSIVQQTNALPRERYTVREGVNDVTYLFAKTKYPYAIYFGTYGRGVFMDTTYVIDHVAETCDSDDWLGISTVDKGENHVSIYPNPAVGNTTVELSVVNAGNAVVKIYDISGKLVHTEGLGYLGEGLHQYSLDCSKFKHGMYLVNINFGSQTATSKLIVR